MTFNNANGKIMESGPGGWVANPANVIIVSTTPSTAATEYSIGTIAIEPAVAAWLCTNNTGINGTVTWTELALAGGTVSELTGTSGGAITPVAGNISILGTANQIVFTGTAGTLTASFVGPYTPATYTQHGVLIGEGTSSIVASSVGATGQVLSGVTGADPAWVNLPAFNIVDNTTGTIASPTTIVVNTKYVADEASVTTGFLLPASATLGQTFSIIGNGPGGWRIKQNASQQIVASGQASTAGTGGSVSSTNKFDCITCTCVVAGASTIWNISDNTGTLTFV